jgi:hypothetical protein
MIGAARVMAAVHAPRMDAVRIKRGIRSVYSLSGSDHSRRSSAREASEHGTALSGTPLSGQARLGALPDGCVLKTVIRAKTESEPVQRPSRDEIPEISIRENLAGERIAAEARAVGTAVSSALSSERVAQSPIPHCRSQRSGFCRICGSQRIFR